MGFGLLAARSCASGAAARAGEAGVQVLTLRTLNLDLEVLGFRV